MTTEPKLSKIVGRGKSISDVELCLDIPVVNNVITLTHCLLVTITLTKYKEALQKYPGLYMEVNNTAKSLWQGYYTLLGNLVYLYRILMHSTRFLY